MAIPSLDAATVARNAGLDLRSKGSRLWACCPLHGEKTPSMCFFPDGRFHCFGCGAHGDAADLYAGLHDVPLVEALRICRGENYTQKPPKYKAPTAADLRQKLDALKGRKWAEACKELHAATADMVKLEEQYTPVQLAQMDAFWVVADRLTTAKDTLHLLEAASMAQLLKMSTEG